MGQEIIQSVLSPVETETDPPILTVEKIEAGISGRVEDKSEISSLRVGFDATPTSEFVSVTASLAEDGSFTLSDATLEAILGTSLNQNSHVLYLEAADIHGNIGVTAIRLGDASAPTNETELNLAVAEVYGLDPYPDGIALPVGGQRQLSLRLNGWPDAGDVIGQKPGFSVEFGGETNISHRNPVSLSPRYFVSHPDIVQVTADGLVTALKEGVATVTIFYGATSVEIPVGIEAPEVGPAVVGEDGGIVVAADGSFVMLPPSALEKESFVSLTSLEKEDLSLEFPPGFEFAGAFNLEFDQERLDLPAQLAIPAPENIEPGTEVYFMRKGALPDSEGNWNPAWLIEESGQVDFDGTIRTTSPPFPGIIRPGEYMVAYSGQTGSATVVQGQLTVSYAFPPAFYGFILPSALPGTSGENLVGMLIDVTAGQGNFNDPSAERRGDWGSLIDGPYYTIPAVTISYDISSLKTFAVPSVGLPIITDTGVQRNAEGIARIDARLDIPAPIESDPLTPPILQEISLSFEDEAVSEPVLFLTGSNILVDESELDDPLGSRFEDLTVEFYVGERVYSGTVLPELSEELGENRFKVAVSVPDTVALGSSRVSLTRRQNQVVGQVGTEPVYEEIELSGNSIRLQEGNEYVFAALQRADMVAVLDGKNPESTVENSNSADILLSRIPVGTAEQLDRPRDLATTSDGTRVYVVLEGSGQVALVDPLMLRQVDTQALVSGINPISLPEGASPKALAIDSRDNYAYITDGNRGEIYVLDLNPASDAFHEVVATLSARELSGGFNQLAISSDGRKLFATGSDNYIYVFNIDPKERPLDPTDQSGKWRQEIGRIPSATGAVAISATADPLKMTFVNGNRNQDGSGFGVIEITNDDPENFAATVTYEDLGIGSFFDYFDVNEGVSVAITRDSNYAFVAGRNWRGNILQSDRREGGNIGIIKDPLGPNPELIAATRPIPGALTASVELSSDNKYLYASYPTLTGSGNVFVFDIEEIARTLENPGQFQIDHLARGVGSALFDASTARSVTAADFETVPIDDINPEISIAADYEILQGDWARQQFSYGVPDDSTRSPVATGGAPMALAASPPDLVELIGPIGSSQSDDQPTTPTFSWEFDIPSAEVSKVNLFVSTFPEGSGLLPWDPVIDLSEVLPNSGLSEEQKQELLSSRWSGYDDFNPNRILTASWTEDDGWEWNGGKNYTSDNTSFTLEAGRTLTAGQTYYWALEVFDDAGNRDLKRGQFDTPPVTNNSPFTSVTVLTHGAVPPINSQSGIPRRLFDLAGDMVNAGGGGLILRYHRPTGNWIPVNRNGGVLTDFPPGQDPSSVDNYLDRLSEYINNYRGQPLVLIPDWAEDNESSVPDSGFTEAAADTFYASLVGLDLALGGTVGERDALGNLVRLYDSAGQLIRTPGALFKSPMHLIGFSRGTVVNSELAQRLLTTFPTIGGTDDENRDFQMTTLDPHDFDQEGLSWPILGGFRNFYEPKIQIWDGITWADNYYQTTAEPGSNVSLTPNGRNIPYLLPPEDTSDAPGLQFPKDENDNFLGVPDLVEFLGTRPGELGYADSRPGFSRQTDPIPGFGGGLGATHGRVMTWYDGSANLELRSINPRPTVNWSDDPGYRRRSDGQYEVLFDEDFYDAYPNRVNPWYVPKHAGANFDNIPEQAPWEGIGTGWFYSVLGGGIQERPYDVNGVKRSRDEIGNFAEFLSEKRVPLDFDNTHSARMRGDAAIPTLFNGNFDAAIDPFGTSLSLIRRSFSNGLPGWSFHNGEDPQIDLVLYLEDMSGVKNKNETDYALKLGDGLTDIVHNRFVVPDWGALRFDLHVPVPATLDDRSDYLEVYLETDTDTYNLMGEQVDPQEILDHFSYEIPPPSVPPEEMRSVSAAVDLREVHPITVGQPLIQSQLNRIGFGSQGFETFQVDVPDEARGKAAKLRFKLHGDTVAYIDNIFFQSEHLKFGNPSFNEQEARPELGHQPNNYLLEKPQYAVSYNDSLKIPNWVSYKLDPSWLVGTNSPRTDFSGDFNLPFGDMVVSQDYRNVSQNGVSPIRGHLVSNQDRGRGTQSYHPINVNGNLEHYDIFKDNFQTFLMTNAVPQPQYDHVWQSLEGDLNNFVKSAGNLRKEIYILAGTLTLDSEDWLPSSTKFPGRSPFNINVPEYLWKVVLVPEKTGQSPTDITDGATTFAVLMQNVPHPSRQNWRNSTVSIVTSVNELEELTGLDFFSNIPDKIEEAIEDNTDTSIIA